MTHIVIVQPNHTKINRCSQFNIYQPVFSKFYQITRFEPLLEYIPGPIPSFLLILQVFLPSAKKIVGGKMIEIAGYGELYQIFLNKVSKSDWFT